MSTVTAVSASFLASQKKSEKLLPIWSYFYLLFLCLKSWWLALSFLADKQPLGSSDKSLSHSKVQQKSLNEAHTLVSMLSELSPLRFNHFQKRWLFRCKLFLSYFYCFTFLCFSVFVMFCFTIVKFFYLHTKLWKVITNIFISVILYLDTSNHI